MKLPVRYILLVLAVAIAIAACSLTTSLDGLSGGASPAVDGSAVDGRADASADADGGPSADAGDAGPRSYRAEVLADSPLSYWRLGESSSGTAASEVTGGITGTYTGGVTFGAPGAIVGDSNAAVSLDGTGSLSLGNNFAFDGTATYTLEAWVKPTTIDATYRRIFSRETYYPAARQGYLTWVQLDYGWGTERFRDSNGEAVTTSRNSVPPIPTGAYYHVVATFDAQQLMHLYINGVEPIQPTPSNNVLASGTRELAVGCIAADRGACFVGAIDEVAIYDHPLTSVRIAAHYRKGSGAP